MPQCRSACSNSRILDSSKRKLQALSSVKSDACFGNNVESWRYLRQGWDAWAWWSCGVWLPMPRRKAIVWLEWHGRSGILSKRTFHRLMGTYLVPQAPQEDRIQKSLLQVSLYREFVHLQSGSFLLLSVVTKQLFGFSSVACYQPHLVAW